MVTKKFQEAYKKLNPEQKKAVDAIEGPVMVIAGPGTGKTQILTLRIANILQKTDTSPDNVLALAFTKSAVASMRKRLVEIVGSDAYRIPIFTFHGFCEDTIKKYPEEFPKIIGSQAIDEVDKITILKKIIDKAKLKTLKPFGDNYFYLKPLSSAISELKRENITVKKLKKLVQKQEKDFKKIPDLHYQSGVYVGRMRGKYKQLEKDIAKNSELLLLYDEYEKEMTKQKLYDYEDMIIETISTLEGKKDLLLRLQEEYQYILADEHQDANNAQNRLLELLSSFHGNPNLFVVGDEKQAIFRFQGASLENFLYFRDKFPDALIVALEDNYRSGQEILDSAHSMITKDGLEDKTLRKPLKAFKKENKTKVALRAFSKLNYEYQFLASDIQRKIESGVAPEEIAVLYRDNKDVEEVIHALEKTTVPFVVESSQNVLADPDINKVIVILRAINNFGDNNLAIELLHIDFFEIANIDIYKLIEHSRKTKKLIWECLKSKTELSKIGLEEPKKLQELQKDVSSWKNLSFNKSFIDFFEIVVAESGFLNHLLLHEDAIGKMEKLNSFFEDIKTLIEQHKAYKLKDFIEYLDLLEEHNILIKKDVSEKTSGNVRLMTAHKAKGLEFDFVYIINAHDGHFGNRRAIKRFKLPIELRSNVDLNDPNSEERRLFYVAMTRARKEVNISYAEENSAGEVQLPSQFVEEIDQKILEKVDVAKLEKEFQKVPGKSFEEKQAPTVPLNDKSYLNELFLRQGLSVTALNNYLTCPWNFFYRNLIRIPTALNKHMMFGIAVHEALKRFFDNFKEGEELTAKNLTFFFEEALKKQPLSDAPFAESLEKGKTALEGYFKNYDKTWSPNIYNEFKIKGVLFPKVQPFKSSRLNLKETMEIKLTGVLDQMVFDEEGKVTVIDFKTGRPKSRNIIEGKTKSSDGNYKRQLVFYKLLLDSFGGPTAKYVMKSATIDFVEPDDKGKYHREEFVVKPEEVKELKQTISSVSQEILELSFWNKTCDDKKCKYCQLRRMLG